MLSKGQRQRFEYLYRSARGWMHHARRTCPNCDCAQYRPVKRKYLVTALVRCENCQILFRIPTDAPSFAADFYQEAYESGFTTDCPSPDELQTLKANRFVGSPKDFSSRLRLLKALSIPRGARIVDYGASWGYGSWQMQTAGWDVTGYEISAPRARYAREMVGVPVFDNLDAVSGLFDVFFSSHVLEHVPRVDDAFQIARRFLRPRGLFIAFTPNGCEARMETDTDRYHRSWGAVHPVCLDDRFYTHVLKGSPKLIATSPYDLARIERWDRRSDEIHDRSGEELLLVTVLNPEKGATIKSNGRLGPSSISNQVP
jgi:2-polyprenyl-3-methyl-5-hydroxy-6-metoxy-1,4-benzoquinol methylase